MSFRRAAARWCATAGGAGYFPVAPATVGSAAGLLLHLAIPAPARPAVLAALLALGFWSAGYSEELFGRKDARQIVIDEVAAMLLMLLLAGAATWRAGAACFVLFRALDVLKPLGIRRLEALPGAAGVMADDLAAALLGAALMRAAAAWGFAP